MTMPIEYDVVVKVSRQKIVKAGKKMSMALAKQCGINVAWEQNKKKGSSKTGNI
jgi:hypothetical protein